MKKLAFFLGKGGVGKTTLSSATAFRLSSSGKKTLICSLDPAHNLGDVFHTRLADEIRPIRENLDGLEIDLAAWVNRYLEESRKEIKEAYRYNQVIDLNGYLDIMKYSPGTEEYAVLWAIEYIYKTHGPSYDIIIFDTPPTALTLRFLAMPAISALWIDELSKLRKTILEKRKILLRLNPDASVLGSAVKKEDDAIYQKLGGIHKRLQKLRILFSEESYISVVLNPDELSFSESLRIRDELSKLKVPISSLCYNKFLIDDVRGERLRQTFKSIPIFTFNRVEEGLLVLDDLARVEVSPLVAHLQSGA
ncbi:ArsA family ATPase [Treponema sp.]